MMHFTSLFKAMMVLLGVRDNSELPDFFKLQNPRDFRPIMQRFQTLGYEDGQFQNILPSCGCSSHSPVTGILPVISAKTSKGENFCFHRALDPILLSQFQRLREFLFENLIYVASQEDVWLFKSIFKKVDFFAELEKYTPCGCNRSIHGVVDFHNQKFPGFYFSPALSMAGSALSRIDFRKCLLDLTKFGTDPDFLLSVQRDRKDDRDERKESVYAQNYVEACDSYERKLLHIQGLIQDPQLSHLPSLFKLMTLEKFEEEQKMCDPMVSETFDKVSTQSESSNSTSTENNQGISHIKLLLILIILLRVYIFQKTI